MRTLQNSGKESCHWHSLGNISPHQPMAGCPWRPRSAQGGVDREAETPRNKQKVWKLPQKCGGY